MILEKSGIWFGSLTPPATDRHHPLNTKLSQTILDREKKLHYSVLQKDMFKCTLFFFRPLSDSGISWNTIPINTIPVWQYFIVFVIFFLSHNIILHLTNFFSLQFILVHLASNSAQVEDSVLEMAASKSYNSLLVFNFCHIFHLMVWKLKWFPF